MTMSEIRQYTVGLQFAVDNNLPPARKALHGALETVCAVIVKASNAEAAEAQVDQIRLALEDSADRQEDSADRQEDTAEADQQR